MSHPSPRPDREHLNIIDPEAGKRYKLHIKGAVHKLTIGKVKHCLATASSCPIPESRMVLKLNGVPLSSDQDVCGSLGILAGATLTVEESTAATRALPSRRMSSSSSQQQQRWQQQQPSFHGSVSDVNDPYRRGTREDFSKSNGGSNVDGDDAYASHFPANDGLDDNDPGENLGSLVSPQRRLLELQTLQEQEHFIHHDNRTRVDALRGSLARMDDELNRASSARRQLERQKREAENELRAIRAKEEAAAKERERLADIQAEEEARAAERAADLAARRDQLRREQEQVRRLAQLKLDNEKQKALLQSQRQAYDEERRRAALAQHALEEEDKHKQLSLRAREIDMEHQRLKYIRGQRELLEERQEALLEKEKMYARMGIEPPVELLREREALEADAAAITSETLQHPLLPWGVAGGGSREAASSVPRIAAVHPAAAAGRGPTATSLSVSPSGTSDSRPIPNHIHKNSNGVVAGGQEPPSGRSSASVSPQSRELVVPTLPDGCYYDPAENAVENLRRLGEDLGLAEPLSFDEANTCVISIDGEYTLLVTYDATTERLFLYSTLLTAIPGGRVNQVTGGGTTTPTPDAAAFRLRLYEYLLEGSLLGRDMCGGGVGASLKNDFILMSTSIYMPTSQPWALRTVAPQFLQCLQHWRERVADFMEGYQRSIGAGPTAAQEVPVYRSASTAPPPSQPQPQPQAQPRAGSLLFSKDDFLSHKSLYQPSQPPRPLLSQQQQLQQQQGGYREAPVIGLEVTDTLLVDGVPTRYSDGVLVVSVAGPAALAGLQPHDVLTAVDGVPVRGVGDFQLIASRLGIGQVVALQVVRGGVPMVLGMQVGSVWVPA